MTKIIRMLLVLGVTAAVAVVPASALGAKKPDRKALKAVPAFGVEVASPIGALRIEHAGGGFKRSRQKRDEEAAAAEEEFRRLTEQHDVDTHLRESLCHALQPRCATGDVDTILTVTPVFVGFRFDQIRNTLYSPSIVLDVTVRQDDTVLMQQRMGIGNVGRLKDIKKYKLVRSFDIHYERPMQVAYDKDRALKGIQLAINDLAYEIGVLLGSE